MMFFLSAEIRIEIINDDHYECCEDFYIQLCDPIWHDKHNLDENELSSDTVKPDGSPILNENNRCKIIIKEDEELKVYNLNKIIN